MTISGSGCGGFGARGLLLRDRGWLFVAGFSFEHLVIELLLQFGGRRFLVFVAANCAILCPLLLFFAFQDCGLFFRFSCLTAFLLIL